MSRVITFYSYKGGVGRSMALVNVATLLSKWGKKVLMMDWDLEAPGLENFFKEELKNVDWAKQKGVIEWLNAQQKGEAVKWQDWVIPFKTSISETDLHLFVSGGANGHYSEMLRDFNISKFYEEHDGGRRLEKFREELLAAYDFVLIDSRTGVTDFGGICTIQMPDMLVMPFSPTEQGLNGTEKIARKVLEAHQKMPLDRFKLLIFPVPSRFDSTPEFETSRRWLHRIAEQLKFLYDDWLPADVSLNDFLQRIKIPYIPYFSFGERLPVIEQGMSDTAGLGYAYESLAILITNNLEDSETFMEDRAAYLAEADGLDYKNFTPDMELALSQLGENCQRLLKMSSLGSSPAEIASAFGLSNANVVKMAVYRCRERLLKVLNEQPDLKKRLREGLSDSSEQDN